MKKKNFFEFNKILMIAIIISFSFLIAGIVGININSDFGESVFVSGNGNQKKFDDQNYVFKNWIENDYANPEYETVYTKEYIENLEKPEIIDGYYQINSMEDWFKVSSFSIYNAYYSINCDLVFNDGYFDDDGTYHDGGDGVCYVASPFVGGYYLYIKGNGHTVKGFYIDDSKMSEEMLAENGGRFLAMFKPITQVNELSDLYIENVYIHSVESKNGDYYGGGTSLCYRTANCFNVHILSGTLRSEMAVRGFCELGTLTNCTNRANIYAGSKIQNNVTTSGLVNRGTLVNCINYGNVDGGGCQVVCGLGGSDVQNCKNYGKIYSNGYTSSGISGYASVQNCKNYGEVIAKNVAQGIGGHTTSDCINYGKVSASTASGIGASKKSFNNINYGEVVANSSAMGIGISQNIIRDCTNYGNVESIKGVAGGISSGDITQISNCKNYGEIKGSTHVGGIIGEQKVDIIVNNCSNFGNIIGMTTSTSIGGIVGHFWGYYYTTSYKPTNYIKNCIVECNFYGTASKAGNFVGLQEESKATTFENCKAITHEYLDIDFGFVFGQIGDNKRINKYNLIKNCEIKTTAHGEGLNYIVVGNTLGELTFDGVVIKEKGGEENSLLVKSSTGAEDYKSIIIEKNNYKYAYGTDLKPYSWKWKTGEIGLKVFDNSFFQGQVTIDYLKSKGFVGDYE